MSSQYYFISSLPALEFRGSLLMNPTEFLENSAQWITSKELSILTALENNYLQKGLHPAIDDLIEWQNAFGNATLIARAHQQNRDLNQYLKGTNVATSFVRSSITEILKLENPLEIEKGIDQLRWAYLDDMACLHQFDFYNIISYFLKIKINQRWLALDQEKGQEVLEKSLTPDN